MLHFSNVGRRLYGESPLSLLFGVSLHPGSPEQCCSIVLSFNTINLSLPPASSSLTTIHNNSSSDLALGFIQTHRIPISFFSASSGLEMEMQEVGEEGLITRDNNYFWRYPRGSQRKIPKHPTPPTMYRQQPKWVKSAFGKSLIISLNQAGYGHWAVI